VVARVDWAQAGGETASGPVARALLEELLADPVEPGAEAADRVAVAVVEDRAMALVPLGQPGVAAPPGSTNRPGAAGRAGAGTRQGAAGPPGGTGPSHPAATEGSAGSVEPAESAGPAASAESSGSAGSARGAFKGVDGAAEGSGPGSSRGSYSGGAASGAPSTGDGAGEPVALRADRLLEAVRGPLARGLGEDGRLTIGVSAAVHSPEGLHGALEEARHARRVAAARPGRVCVAGHDELASHVLLLPFVPDDVRRAFTARLLDPLRDYDRRHRAELIPTLEAFLECDGSWTRCASRLHLHVNTLRYRIGRIEQLTGRDLARLEDKLDFFLALRMS
jgi:hypothetical protein